MSSNCRAAAPLELTLGVPSASRGFGGRLIERAASLPGTCRLQIVDGWSRFIADWLVAGRLDLGLIYDHTCDDPAIAAHGLCQATSKRRAGVTIT